MNGRKEGIEEGESNEQSLWNNTNFTLNRLQITASRLVHTKFKCVNNKIVYKFNICALIVF